MARIITHPNHERGESIVLPQVYTCTMTGPEADKRVLASLKLTGIQFSQRPLDEKEKVIGETTVTVLQDLKELNNRLGLGNKETKQW